jgi:hypothetical protein
MRFRIPGCVSLEHPVAVAQPDGGGLEGAMELDKNVLLKGPQGTPGWGRLGVAFWMPFVVGGNGNLPDAYTTNPGNLYGIALDAGVVTRWFSMGLEFDYGAGSSTRSTFTSNYQLPSSSTTTITRGSLRLGPRFPFNVVSFGFGPVVGVEQVNYEAVLTGGVGAFLGSYAEVVVEPLCAFGVYFLAEGGFDTNISLGVGSLNFGAMFEPSSACKKERTTVFGLHEMTASAAAPPEGIPASAVPAPAAAPAVPVFPAPGVAVPAPAVPVPPVPAPPVPEPVAPAPPH